tara:strand:+ start:96 stop:308 length:213 start_codon:yes stop_codon:yes gene_type:complete
MSELLKKLNAKQEEVCEAFKNLGLMQIQLGPIEFIEAENRMFYDTGCLLEAIDEEERRIKVAHAMELISK